MSHERPTPPPEGSSGGRVFSFADLVSGWRDFRRWGDAHPDLVAHYQARYRGLAGAFGVDLEKPPTPPPRKPSWLVPPDNYVAAPDDQWIAMMDRDWGREVHGFALRQEAQWRWFESPFAGYVEMPMSIRAVRRHYAPSLEAVAEVRRAIDAMIDDLMRALYPDAAERTVTADELRAAGFDPDAREPDLADYW